MSNDRVTWVDCETWRDRWETERRLSGGGQGEAFRARRKSDRQIAFLKVIKSAQDPERRARFFREASAYDTFSVGKAPSLIESNAHRHKDSRFVPYIATEFIEGPTLREWRTQQSRVTLDDAIAVTRSLLVTLRECHAANCVHRDVKPDNIILVEAEPTRIALLDFGLNFHEIKDVSFQTEFGQEIGNRFLRLPELSAGSSLKQDPRSDLSFAAGILFYAITGEHPDLLQDAEGRLPHQRPRALSSLQHVGGDRYARLASLFDNAFAPRIADRFSSADAMLANLDKVMEAPTTGGSVEDDLKAILEVIDTASERRRSETINRLREALNQVQRVHNKVGGSLGKALSLGQTGYSVTGEVGRNTLFWTRLGSNEHLVSTAYEAKEAGDEITITMAGETVYRTSISSPNYGDEFERSITAWVLAHIRSALSDPHALPPEADNFQEIRPFAVLSDAGEEARRSRRSILAFVYDPVQKDRGGLQHCLSYFLKNRKTREAINAAFVVALVPLSQVSATSTALQGLSMETSRWAVFDPDLVMRDQAVIYANPQEGERIALDLAKRFGPG